MSHLVLQLPEELLGRVLPRLLGLLPQVGLLDVVNLNYTPTSLAIFFIFRN